MTQTHQTAAIVIGVTSKKGGVGKSVVATMIAWAAEQLGQRAVLMDLDPSNPDQLARDRVRYANVPKRMPTVTDDSYPTQWWSDPETGVQLIPGPTRDRDRTDRALIAGARRLIPRAHGAADIVVLDLHQVSADEYSHELIALCNLVVCVTDHDTQSRQHLRAWLDEVTDDAAVVDPLQPTLRAEQIRLVYSEGVPMTTSAASQAWSEARADIGPQYTWAGQIPFDPDIIVGGNQGDITRTVSDTTRQAVLQITTELIGTKRPDPVSPTPRSRTASGHPWAPPRLPTTTPPAAAATTSASSAPQPDDPADAPTVRVFGSPRVDGHPDLPERELAIATLLSVRAPISVDATGEIFGVSAKTISNAVSRLKGLVASERGLLTLEHGIRSELATAANNAEALAGADNSETITLISQGIRILNSVSGPPFDVHLSQRWAWVHERLHAGPTPTERALLELGNLARAITNQWIAMSRADQTGLPAGSVVTGALVSACDRAAMTIDPLPLLAAAAQVAAFAGPADRALVTSKLNAIMQDGWPVSDELIASLR
jgi:CobQ/CobB/MinD/ParA nucleotide binding domain